MRNDLEELDVEFNFHAKEAFYILYTRFNTAITKLNRQEDENVFQLTRSQYRQTLKTELERIAISLIGKNTEIREVDLLTRNLTNSINDYLKEFMIKSQAI